MKERPIIFNTESVRAILAGRKTQTRRVVKNRHFSEDFHARSGVVGVAQALREYGIDQLHVKCPYGQSGDRLWVKETFNIGFSEREIDGDPATGEGMDPVYQADRENEHPMPEYEYDKWQSPIFMPRWVCRIILEINEVRVERLQDISEEDAWAEGVNYGWTRDNLSIPIEKVFLPDLKFADPRPTFRSLWDSINGKNNTSWVDNPWVWVISFRLIES